MDDDFMRLGATDMADVAELEASCFSSPWTEEQLLNALRLPHFIVYGLKRQGLVLAYVSLSVMASEIEVLNLATRQDFRRQGLGKQLLTKALAAHAKMESGETAVLEVRAGNAPACGLYQSLGFVEVGRRKHYYQDNGEDALIMIKILG